MNDNICNFSSIRSSDLACTRFVYEQTDVQSQPTVAQGHVIGFAVHGEGRLTQVGRSYDIGKATAFFVRNGSRFAVTDQHDLKYFYLSFCGRRADELIQRFEFSENHCVFDLSEHYTVLSAFFFDCLHRSTDRNTDLFGEAGLLYLLAHLDVKEKTCNGLLSEMIRLTNEGFTDCNFSLRTLSEKLNYDAKYLSFFFKKNKGICYSYYLRDLRIRHSIFLMEQGITGVKNVAALSGFSDALYYSKIFKTEMNCSPKEYIERLSASDK